MKMVSKLTAILLCICLVLLSVTACKPKNNPDKNNSSSGGVSSENSSSDPGEPSPGDNDGEIDEPDEELPDYDDDDELDFDDTDGNGSGGDDFVYEDDDKIVDLPDSIKDVNDYNLLNNSSSRLKLTSKSQLSAKENKLQVNFSDKGKGTYVFAEGDYLEYDVMMSGNTIGTGLVEIEVDNGVKSLSKIATAYDMEGLKVGKGESLGAIASNVWYHRRIKIPNELIGKTLYRWNLYQSSTINGQITTTYFDNIKITNGNSDKLVAYSDGKLEKNVIIQRDGVEKFSLKVSQIYKQEIVPQGDFLRMTVKNDVLTEKQSSFIAYMISNKGKGTYKLKKGDALIYKIRHVDPILRGGTVDIHFTDNTWLTDCENLNDEKGFSVRADENISGVAGGQWYYRKIIITDALVGKTVDYFTLSTLNNESENKYEIQVADIKIINGNKTNLLVYGGGAVKNGGLVAARNASVSISKNHSISSIGKPSGDYLKYSVYSQNIAKATAETKISSDKYTIKNGDCLEYDITCDDVMVNSGFGIQLSVDGGANIKFSGWRDQNAISGSSGIDISSYTANQWYHRKINLGNSVGDTIKEWILSCEMASVENTGISGKQLTAGFDNIRITNNGKTVKTIYSNGAPKQNIITKRISNDKCIVSSVPVNAPAPLYQVPALSLEAEDTPIITYNVKNFGAKGDGKADDTNAIQSALYAAADIGGGVVFVPSGKYKVLGHLNVPEGVTLRGEWKNPLNGGNGKGTIFMAYAGKGEIDDYSFIIMETGAALSHISVWYPEQNAAKPIAYPWTIQTVIGDSVNIKNVTLYNSYRAMKFGPRSNSVHMVENVYGTVLERGIENDCSFDTPRFVNITFTPDVWAKSGFSSAPSGSTLNTLKTYLVNNFEAFRTGRVDFFEFYGIKIDYAKIAMRFSEARDIEPHSITQAGAFANGAMIQFSHVNTGIQADAASKIGIVFASGSISATEGTNPVAVKTTDKFDSYVGLSDITLSSSGKVITGAGVGTISLQGCKVNSWKTDDYAIDVNKGVLVVTGCNFAKSGKHINLAKSARGATINANTFSGQANINNLVEAADAVTVSHQSAQLNTSKINAEYTFRNAPKAGTNKVFLASKYGVKGDGRTDDTQAIQKAIDAAAAAGGGIVYFPNGKYVIKGYLTVKPKVELRGIYTSRHNSSKASSMFLIYTGRNDENGKAAIILKDGAGINGIDFFYPEQLAWNITPYAWTVQCQGTGAFLMNAIFVNAFQGVDFGTYNSDKHFISGVGGTFLRKGIFVGNSPTYGTLENVHIIMNYWIMYQAYGTLPPNPYNTFDQPVYKYQGLHLENYIFGDCNNEQLLTVFCWSGAKSAVFVDQGNGGFAGKFVIPGFDGAPILMDVHNAKDINIYAPFLYAHGLDVYTTRSYLRSYATNKGNVNIVNAGAGEHSYPIEGFYIEGGTVDIHQFNFASSAKNYNAYITGGTVRLSGIVACPITTAYAPESNKAKNSLDMVIGSDVISVEVTGYLGINRPLLRITNNAGDKYKAVGLANVEPIPLN